jgi:hypothetical protein
MEARKMVPGEHGACFPRGKADAGRTRKKLGKHWRNRQALLGDHLESLNTASSFGSSGALVDGL